MIPVKLAQVPMLDVAESLRMIISFSPILFCHPRSFKPTYEPDPGGVWYPMRVEVFDTVAEMVFG